MYILYFGAAFIFDLTLWKLLLANITLLIDNICLYLTFNHYFDDKYVYSCGCLCQNYCLSLFHLSLTDHETSSSNEDDSISVERNVANEIELAAASVPTGTTMNKQVTTESIATTDPEQLTIDPAESIVVATSITDTMAKLDNLYENKWLFWSTVIILGVGVSFGLYFVPDRGDNENTDIYRGEPYLIIFTLWYCLCNIVSSWMTYLLYPNNKFSVCLIVTGFVWGAMEHFDVFINEASLYERNESVYQFYLFNMGITLGTLPGWILMIPFFLKLRVKFLFIGAVIFLSFATGWFLNISLINILPFGPDLRWHIEHCLFHGSSMVGGVVTYVYVKCTHKEQLVFRS